MEILFVDHTIATPDQQSIEKIQRRETKLLVGLYDTLYSE